MKGSDLKTQYQFMKEAASQYSLSFLFAPATERKFILLQGLPERLQDASWDT